MHICNMIEFYFTPFPVVWWNSFISSEFIQFYKSVWNSYDLFFWPVVKSKLVNWNLREVFFRIYNVINFTVPEFVNALKIITYHEKIYFLFREKKWEKTKIILWCILKFINKDISEFFARFFFQISIFFKKLRCMVDHVFKLYQEFIFFIIVITVFNIDNFIEQLRCFQFGYYLFIKMVNIVWELYNSCDGES